MARGDAADRLAHEQLLVRPAQRRRVRGGDLVLAVPELRVVLLEPDLLGVECRRQVVDVVLRRGGADRREAEPRVDRDEPSVDPGRERELVLECDLEPLAALGQTVFHPLQERALACRGIAVELHVVDEHGAHPRRVRKNAKRVRVGNEPDLTDRPHAFDRLELVERVHRLHRDGQPDPALDPGVETVHGARLRAHRPVVPAPEEADEAEARLVRLLHDVTCFH